MKGLKRSRRSKKITVRVITAAVSLLAILAILIGQVTTSAAADTAVADEGTMKSWEDTIQDNTENVGRVWTDKSVFSSDSVTTPEGTITVSKDTDADFLVALSALSSAASVTGEISSAQPLDIVLVLDRSGSMGNVMTYTEAYVESTVTSGTYYVLVDGTYYEVKYNNSGSSRGWYYTTSSGGGGGGQGGNNRTYVTPKASETDTTQGSVQFYTAVTRMDALKSAVNTFIEATYEANLNISDEDNQHRISIVSFSSNYQNASEVASEVTTHCDLTAVTSSNKSTLEGYVNSMTALGGTRADSGLSAASSVILGNTARSDAKKVVIFFTDGEPTSGNSFEATVANNAVSYAKTMKDNGVTIYSIGIFDGADTTTVPTISGQSSDTDRANSFMQAVSSNYPSATAYDTLGEGAENSDYYKATGDAEELEEIFKEIVSKITTAAAKSPTQIETGLGFDDSGYITFTDTLGDYMEVSGFSAIVYNGVEYTAQGTPATVRNAGNTGYITTYTFTDNVAANALEDGAQISLSYIIITVESFDDASKGDIVTVKIPASLIPLWIYEVDDNGDGTFSTTATEAFPISIFYNVKVKDAVEGLLEDPDETMQAYIDANTDSDGKVRFYANKYDASDSTTVTSSFVPSSTNNFYYFQEDEILYTREGEEGSYTYTIATGTLDSNETYYYEREYYVETEGTTGAAQATYWTAVAGDSALALRGYIKTNSDKQLYIAAGTPRLSSLEERFEQDKAENTTETAAYVIDPDWESDGTTVTNALGNNGYITRDVPGTLVVEKKVESAAGHTTGSTDTFTFTLTLSDTQGSYNAQIFNSDGTAAGAAFTVSSGSTFALTNGQYIKVYGLADGVEYAVAETAKTGYTAAYSVSNSGTITGGAISTVTVTNTYKAEEVTLEGFGVTKNYDSWTQTPDEVFTFILESETEGAPMPEGAADGKASITISADDAEGKASVAKAFGSITYDTPGTYTYLIYEQSSSAATAGINYSYARYRVTVTVADAGGQLTASATMTRIYDDSGTAPETATAADSAEFTNTFSADSVDAAILGTKSYTDSTGSKDLTDGMFTFRVTLDSEASATGKYPSGVELLQDSNNNCYYTVANTGKTFTSGAITFTSSDVGKSYTYTVQEVIPDEVIRSGTYNETANTYTYQGMTYDASVYTVTLAISAQTAAEGSGTVVAVTRTYTKNGQTWEADDQGVVFTNSYDAADVTIGGSTGSGLAVTKYIDGRELNSGETFSFYLTADSATVAAVNSGDVVISGLTAGSLTEADTLGTVTVSSLETASYFSDITFSRVGTYTFYIRENIPEGATAENNYTVNGLTYDTSVITATVTVTDEGGELKAAVAYSNNKDTAEFTNTYRSSAYYGNGSGLQVSKTLTGRNMNAGEFAFTITAENDNAKAKGLAAADAAFTNASQRADGIAEVMTKLDTLQFTQADAGKTFTYTISETAGSAGGVTYDATVYTVEIAVSDDGAGNITTVTTVKKDNDSTYSVTYNSADNKIATVEFANTYAAEPAELTGSADLKVEKTISGRDWLQTDEFTFSLEAGNDATQTAVSSEKVVLPENAAGITISADSLSDGAYTAAFGDITFKETGDYVFKIIEASGSISGMSYDATEYKVIIVVEDDGQGELYIDFEESVIPDLNFLNTYTPDPADASVDLTKTIDGRSFRSDVDVYSFTMTSAADNGPNAPVPTAYTVYNDSNGSITYTFTGITKDQVGTYVYEVTEDDTSVTGITKDNSVITVTLTVAYDETTGELTAETETSKDGFVNSYSPIATTISGFTITKSVEVTAGSAYTMSAGEFEFTVTPGAGNPSTDPIGAVTLTNAADGTVAFGADAEYIEAGTYTYTVKESAGGAHGMSYDNTVYTVVVTVTENDGRLSAVTSITDENNNSVQQLTFANTYTPDPDDPEKPGKTVEIGDGDDTCDNGEEVYVGQTLKYTISYYNNLNTASRVVVTDELDDGVDFVSASCGSVTLNSGNVSAEGTGVTIAYDSTAHTVTWTLNSVDAFSRGEVTLTVTVNENAKDAGASVENSASVTVGNQTSQISDPVENPIVPDDPADPVKAVSSDSPSGQDGESVGVGSVIVYTIDYYNYNNQAAAITITDKLDPGVDFQSASNGGTYDEATGTVTWNLTAEAFAEGTVTLNVVVNENAKQLADGETQASVENQATVIIGGNTYDTNTVVNPISPDDPEDPEKVVAADSEAGVNGESVQTGDRITFEITYYNHTNEAADVNITDVLQTGLTYISSTGGGTESAGTVTWTIGNVAPYTGGTVTVTVEVTEDALEEKEVGNYATVTIGENKADTNLVTIPVDDTPRDPVKTVDTDGDGDSSDEGAYVAVGDTLEYTIGYYNYKGSSSVIVITDELDGGVDFVEASDGGVYDPGTHTVTWTIQAAAHEEGEVALTVTVNEDARVADADGDASVENKAGIKIGNDVYRYSETVENPVEPDDPEKPGKTVDADGDGSSSDAGTAVSVGDTLVYTISYYNNLNTAADVVITDVLDSGVDFVEASDEGVYDPETHTVTWTIKDVAAFGRGEVTVTVTVNEDALTVDADGSTSIENTASVTVGSQTSQSSDPVKNPVEEDEPETPEEEESETPEEEESETPEETTGDGTASGDEPDTGDSQVNLALWVIIMVAAIIGITNLTAVYIRRRKRDEDR